MMMKRLAYSALLPIGIVTALPAGAAEWTRSASVAPAITYTDNVCLDRDNKQEEWIALLTPSGSISGKGRRASVSINGSVEFNSLSNSDLEDSDCGSRGYGDREQFSPRINGTGNAILVDDWLYIDGRVNANQNEIGAFRSGGGDSLDRTGNTNTTYRYDVSPYVKRRFKDVADLLVRYRYSDEYNTADIVGQNEEHAVLATLGGNSSSALSWSLQGDYSKVVYDETQGRQSDADDSELKSARVNLGYQLTRAWQVNGHYGQEWNDFVSERDDIDGDFWEVGFRWAPSSRTSVEAGTGNRFFGDTKRFAINHRHKRSSFRMDYSEDITYDRDIRTLDSDLSGGDFDPLNPTTLTNSPILDERFTLTYAYGGRRINFNLSGSHSDQTRAEDGRDSTFQRASASLRYNLAKSLSVSGRLSWDEQDPKGERSEFVTQAETYRAFMGMSKRLTESTSLSLNYEYTDRQSDNDFDEYKENRVTLTLSIGLL